jgi:hypothetical protein
VLFIEVLAVEFFADDVRRDNAAGRHDFRTKRVLLGLEAV